MDVDDGARVPDITLERYRLGELPSAERARLDERLRRDGELRGRLDALERSDAEMHAGHELTLMAARVRATLDTRQTTGRAASSWPTRWAVPLIVAAAVLTLVVVIPRTATVPGEDRIKGLEPGLTLYRRVGSGSETLADGAVVHAGDVIRVGYHAAGRQYGAILSIDGRGVVTVHLPSAGDQAVALGREPTVLLEQAYELDDAPRWERFYFITAETPFTVSPLVTSARRIASQASDRPVFLALPEGLDQSIFSLQKETRP